VTRWLTTLLIYGSAFVGAGLLATACDPSYGITSFRCDPSNPSCPSDKYGTGTYVCCSDDPAALDSSDPDAAVLPKYSDGSGTGTPLFSAANNHLSKSGFCIDTSVVPLSAAITDVGTGQGCPLPCNPTWGKADIATVCGPGTICCQTQELGEDDCALDPSLGDNGCFRPVTGGDIDGFGGLDVSGWNSSAHDTHQDPNGTGCLAFIGGDNKQALEGCFKRLSVADQRGFCQSGTCATDDPSYLSACQRMNLAQGLTNCP
jgi:hypothetical protein